MVDRRRSLDDTQRSPTDTGAVFEVLSNERRRYVLHCLREYANPMPLADLADEVATWEHEASVADVPPEETKRIYLSLYHKHIPKMADAGLVRYDQEQDSVSVLERAEQLGEEHDVSFGE